MGEFPFNFKGVKNHCTEEPEIVEWAHKIMKELNHWYVCPVCKQRLPILTYKEVEIWSK
jgi:hypothetical protein